MTRAALQGLVFCLVIGLVLAVPARAADDVPAELLIDAKGGKVDRGHLVIVGSEAMGPFTAALSKRLLDQYQIPAPEEQKAGTHAGFTRFCAGIGAAFPDIIAASRRMRQTELDRCLEHGVADIIEVPIGHSAIVFVARKGDAPLKLTSRILYQAVAKEVPQGPELAANPNQRWQQIDRSLPNDEIRVLLPVVTAGIRNFFDDIFMQGGCRKFGLIKNIFDDVDRVKLCVTPRRDDRVVEMAADYDSALPEKLLESPPGTIGILPYFVAMADRDRLQILPVEGVLPTPATIADDSYEGVNTLYYYLKRAHMRDAEGHGVVRGLRQFIIAATSEEARGPAGYLTALGLVPLQADDRAQERRSALRLERFNR